MCGLAGYAGIKESDMRAFLVWALGAEIDVRGGDAIGYVSLAARGLQYGRRPGEWSHAKRRFIHAAAQGETAMLHARMATCGWNPRDVNEAHPFAIRRHDRTIYGAHNGVIYNARESAARYGRPYTVDSKELFELLADRRYDEISSLQGYGVITWIDSSDLAGGVRMARLTGSGEIYVASLAKGGIVWGSTEGIVQSAIDMTDWTIAGTYTIDPGTVYLLRGDGVFRWTDHPEVTVSAKPRLGRVSSKAWDLTDAWEDDADTPPTGYYQESAMFAGLTSEERTRFAAWLEGKQ